MSFIKLEKFILVAIFIFFQTTYVYSTQPIKFIDKLVSETTLILSSNQSEDLKIVKLKKKDSVLDIASNDGTLLSFYKKIFLELE